MFVTRALAATALAGMAFGLTAPVAFADDLSPVQAVSGWDCGHHHSRGDNDPGRGDNDPGRGMSRDHDQAWTGRAGQEKSGNWGDPGDHDGHGKHCHFPSRGARTGLGGSITGMNTTQTALGGGLLATALAGGTVYLKRRRVGGDV